MDLVVQVLNHDIPTSVLAPEVLDCRVEVAFYPHPLAASLILEVDGEVAGLQTFCDEATEDNPGTACLPGQNVLNGPTLRLIGPFINIKCLAPTSSNHQLRGIIKDDNIEIIEGNFKELPLVDVDCPVPHAPLIVTELSIRDVSMADDLTVTILKNKSLDPPFLFN